MITITSLHQLIIDIHTWNYLQDDMDDFFQDAASAAVADICKVHSEALKKDIARKASKTHFDYTRSIKKGTDMTDKINDIQAIVDEARRMRNAIFFNSPRTASERWSYEKRHSHDKVTWEEGGHKYTAEFNVHCSARNVYARGYYTLDGERTTMTAIKNSLKRLKT